MAPQDVFVKVSAKADKSFLTILGPSTMIPVFFDWNNAPGKLTGIVQRIKRGHTQSLCKLDISEDSASILKLQLVFYTIVGHSSIHLV